MDRLKMLKSTLPHNLDQFSSIENTNFYLLDYNSSDGLEEWVKGNLLKYIETRKLHYFKLLDPQVTTFSHSHSRNIIFRLADQEFICNVNADYYIESSYIDQIMTQISDDLSSFLVMNPESADKDNYGRLCVRKKHFLSIRGFDERFNGYGYEDFDFYNRLKLAGYEEKLISSSSCYDYIEHTDMARIEKMPDVREVLKVYIEYVSVNSSNLLFLKRDNRFEFGTVSLDNMKYGYEHVPRLDQKLWLKGSWNLRLDSYCLVFDSGIEMILGVLKNCNYDAIGNSAKVLYHVSNGEYINRILLKKMIIYNYQLMNNNLEDKISVVNPLCFGKAIVEANFVKRISLE